MGALESFGELFQAIVENLAEGVLVADLQSLVLYLNPVMIDILGVSASEVLGRPLHRVLPSAQGWPDRRPGMGYSRLDVCEFYEATLGRSAREGNHSFTVQVQEAPLFNQRGELMAILIRVNPSHLRNREDQPTHPSQEKVVHIDALTGLPNRPLFMERLESAIVRARQDPHYWFAVLFLDLDRFKVINDSLGHLAGDQLLITIARRLESCLRPTDIVARMGGDEFTILVDDIVDVADATTIAERIHRELAKPFNLDGHEVFTSVSIGIALGRDNTTGQPYESSEDLLRNADLAMYQSKSMGRAGHQVFDIAMHVRVVEQLELENSLRRAVERQEFCLLYQPIISLDTGRVSGFEALVRWQHPRRGQVLPEEFIATAEETGLINRLGHWVLQQACRQMRVWQRRFPIYPPLAIGVNLSSKQLAQPDLIDQITRVLEETQLEPNSLKLEITESMIMHNTEAATVLLEQLRSHNIQLCIDDFGTGYSSLSHLRRFPINTLKIDRSFISKMHVDEENLAIVKTIVTLAHTLGIYITAEGVESNE
ncbi:MAG: EAL domain-containing protein, partial [Leptolyngbyaceae cyanobacterium bins.59]|nr:EAL domain-containing protein [Leptolyngbyaceae cyanobacterium bins.59]